MSNDNNNNDDGEWKDTLAYAALVVAVCLSLATCQYVGHIVDSMPDKPNPNMETKK